MKKVNERKKEIDTMLVVLFATDIIWALLFGIVIGKFILK